MRWATKACEWTNTQKGHMGGLSSFEESAIEDKAYLFLLLGLVKIVE